MHHTPSRPQRRRGLRPSLLVTVAALTVALLAGLAPSAPAGAAPPPAAHPGLVNPDPIDVTPHILDGRTEAVLDLGDRVIVGGTFTKVKRYSQPAQFARSYLFAYDKATGVVDTTFLPQPNGRVNALLLAADGGVLVGGQFTSIGGRSIPYLAKLDPRTGAASATFAPRPNGMVYDLHQANGLVYLGGSFGKVGTATRTSFAAVDPTTGAVRGNDIAFASAPRGVTRLMRFDISPDGRKLVGIGNFTRVGGQVRENVAVLDLAANGTATVSGWRTDRYKDLTCGNASSSWTTPTYDVDMSPDGSWFVIVTTGGPGGTTKLCDTATRWETGVTSTASPTWVNWTGGDSLTSVAVTGAAVYVAGHNRWLDNPQGRDTKGPGAVDRQGIGALSPTTGKALSWNPGRERGLVAPRIVATAEGLYVLSDSSGFGGEWHPRLTYLTLTGTLPPPGRPGAPGVPSVTAATATSATLSWAAATPASTVSGYTVTARAGSTVVATKDTGTALTTTLTGLPAARALAFTVTAKGPGGTSAASGGATTVLPFTTVDAFTTQQFRDLVGRAPTGAELADWRTRVGGSSLAPAAAVDALMDSAAVGKVASVVRLYRAYYRRLPDAGGFRYWRDQGRNGMTIDRMSEYFASLAEFRTLYGNLNDTQFVDLVYRNVLNRAPDASGRSYWVGELRRLSRGRVMTLFSESPENKTVTKPTTDIVLVTHLLLDRVPTTGERAWTGTRAALVETVLASTAYDARV